MRSFTLLFPGLLLLLSAPRFVRPELVGYALVCVAVFLVGGVIAHILEEQLRVMKGKE